MDHPLNLSFSKVLSLLLLPLFSQYHMYPHFIFPLSIFSLPLHPPSYLSPSLSPGPVSVGRGSRREEENSSIQIEEWSHGFNVQLRQEKDKSVRFGELDGGEKDKGKMERLEEKMFRKKEKGDSQEGDEKKEGLTD